MERSIDNKNMIEYMVESYESGRVSRRAFIGCMAALMGAGQASQVAAAADASPFTAVNTNHLALRVTDIGRSREFYRRVLGMRVASEDATSCFLNMPTGFLTLFRGDTPGLDHFCFGVENYDVEKAQKILMDAGLKPRRPQGTDRIYFDDPDGLEVQISAADHGA